MTLHPFRRKSDISPEDRLDAWLNARTPMTPNDNPTEPEGESLAGAAQQFHAWADEAQQRDPDAKGPADDLWMVILAGRGRLHVDPAQTDRSVGEMDRTIQAPIVDHVPPRSNRTRRAREVPQSRTGAWFNAIAAALLILTLGGGAYLAGNGGFGIGGGDDEGRFAAQVVSPEASPGASPEATQLIGSVNYQVDGVCTVEPLTEDQVFDIVMNPLNGFVAQGIETEGTPEPLLEVPWRGGDQPRPSSFPDSGPLHRASEEEAEAVFNFVNEYYECLDAGTNYQLWAITAPYWVQSRILYNFPVLRSEEQIRAYISEIGPQGYEATVFFDTYAEGYFDDGYRLQGNLNPLSIWVNDEYDWPDVIILSGVSVVDEKDGEVISAVSYEGRPYVLQQGGPGVPETLEIMYFSETNTWYISATYSLKG